MECTYNGCSAGEGGAPFKTPALAPADALAHLGLHREAAHGKHGDDAGVDAERVHHPNQLSQKAKHVLTQPAKKQSQAKQQHANWQQANWQPAKQPPDKQPPAKHSPTVPTKVNHVLAPETQHATKENVLNKKKLSQEGRDEKEDDATEDNATED